jgi:hypothetical protein
MGHGVRIKAPCARRSRVPAALEAVAEADALAGAGRCLEAIEVLNLANRCNRSVDIDRRLVQLRHDAFQELRESDRTSAWPPPLRDPFPHSGGLVEVESDELSVEIIGGAIIHHGCVLVRRLVPSTVAALLVEATVLAFEAQERWRDGVESNHADNSAESPWFEPFAVNPRYALDPFHLPLVRMNRDYHRVLLADSPPAMFDVVEALEHVGMRRLLADYFGEQPVMTVSKTVLRRVPYQPQTLGWHQDAAVFGRPAPSLNCWIALTDCGDDSPGLEVLPLRVDHVIDTPGNRGLSRADKAMGHFPRLQGVTPTFAPGDALLFDDLLVHRTAMTERMTRTRFSIENWFFTTQGLPSNNAPIVF